MSQQRGYGRGDELGTWAPIGGSGSEKELIKLPAEAEKLAPLAGTLIRSRIKEKLRGYYGLAATLIGDHPQGQAFIINMMGAGLGEGGFARNEFLMGLARMLVPTAMPSQQYGNNGQYQRTAPGTKNNGDKGDQISD